MASLTPEHYRITKDKAGIYISDIESYLSKNHAVFLMDDVNMQIAEGYKILGRIEVMLEALNEDSKKRNEWEQCRMKVENAIEGMKNGNNMCW